MDRVLLLNGDYRPLGTKSIEKAVGLLIRGRAYGVAGVPPARRLRTPNTVFEVPSVIVLQRFINVPSRTKKWSRSGVFERDNYTCIFCGRSRAANGMGYKDFTIEHIAPKSRGGKSTWSNTACACYDCNHRKADRYPHEAGMSLLWEPKTPRTNYWKASGNIPVEWKYWLNA